MLSPFVYADEWVFAESSHLLVQDFVCWRKSGKRGRLFEPYLHLRTKDGQFDIVFDGYDQVWSLLNALIHKPPRMDFNRLMKGRIENATFMGELGWFLENSDAILCFESHLKEIDVANSTHTIKAHSVTSAKSVRCEVVWPYLSYAHILTPSRTPAGLVWRETSVCGSHPQLIFATKDRTLIAFVSAPKSPNYRPLNESRYDNDMSFIAALSDLEYRMSEHTYAIIPQRSMRDTRGMYDKERDDYELGIFLNAQNKLEKKKRGD